MPMTHKTDTWCPSHTAMWRKLVQCFGRASFIWIRHTNLDYSMVSLIFPQNDSSSLMVHQSFCPSPVRRKPIVTTSYSGPTEVTSSRFVLSFASPCCYVALASRFNHAKPFPRSHPHADTSPATWMQTRTRAVLPSHLRPTLLEKAYCSVRICKSRIA
ncbi:hypothetical protein AG1IA_03517 [Rhizoctonia solani AG-1 IA]|uniref:Uncharacterized protein n=1 Tax=Thanatephorus cucumeris (strain AG1-IA) TaxID=983506 RepID=L8X089_THACA|nr:hypothetical protein AG1IA_03517 [Rhizoctonia solani AG-1 IA]